MWLEEQSKLAQYKKRRIRKTKEIRKIKQTKYEQIKIIERYLINQKLTRARVERIIRAEKIKFDRPKKFV